MPKPRFPDEAREWVARRYRNRHCQWLAGEGTWPLRISLGAMTEEEAQGSPALLREWVRAWRGWLSPAAAVVWCERRWRSLGLQSLPESLVINGPAEAAILAGEEQHWTRAAAHHRALSIRWPAVAAHAAKRFDELAALSDRDIERLIAFLSWLEANPASQLFARQVPVAGLDTKWLQPRLPLVAELIAAMRGYEGEARSSYAMCGLRELPSTIRLRILDPELRRHFAGLGDITARVGDLRSVSLPAKHVVIVENLQTGLAFADMPGTVVIMKLGYGVPLLGGIPWIANADCTYWGDLDTHGFAMLNSVRSCYPHMQSLLMDEATLLRNRDLWGIEPVQCLTGDLAFLSAPERNVYHGLQQQRWGLNVRLEQERIPWDQATEALIRQSRQKQGEKRHPLGDVV